ncbi:MAG TPA: hypothetical protein PKW35_21730 [Nannocystaceae bacterium]|nr:hypothetical protein [Nannocystaceae bacterium]
MSARDPTETLLLVLTAFMGAMIALIAYVAFFQRPQAPPPQPAAQAPTCDPRSLDVAQCPAGTVCIAGRCDQEPPIPICGDADPCDACECPGERVCYLGRCRDRPPPPDEVCLQPTVRAAMTYLARECGKGGHERDILRSNVGCSADDWKRLAIDPDRFDAILGAFPDRFSIHFESGAPRGTAPLPAAVRDHYVAAIAGHRDALRSAKQILVIGRASPDGDPGRNYQISLRRIDEVTGLVREVIGAGEPGAPRVPLRAWSLAGESPLTPARFRSYYSRSPITWDAAADARLLDGIRPGEAPPEGEAWSWLFGAINRVVLVVPIPCDGTEWDPKEESSFRGDPPPEVAR